MTDTIESLRARAEAAEAERDDYRDAASSEADRVNELTQAYLNLLTERDRLRSACEAARDAMRASGWHIAVTDDEATPGMIDIVTEAYEAVRIASIPSEQIERIRDLMDKDDQPSIFVAYACYGTEGCGEPVYVGTDLVAALEAGMSHCSRTSMVYEEWRDGKMVRRFGEDAKR